MKEQNLLDEEWDICIVLDACRYDVFKDLYKEYLRGELEKRKSKGSNTLSWLKNTFPKTYNITYVSSNPFISSLDLRFYTSFFDWEMKYY
ncbi:hypothetical protein C9439_03940 [archaeon SCG-AAA382B04]|nr:hypothetical protein C9439_03940 [archaeon SCG-AAA382B04]